MKHIISIFLVGSALSLVAHGGLLSKLLGDVSIEINACPQIAIDLSGSTAQDTQPVFQSVNPACPNYIPPSELFDAVQKMQNATSSAPIPGLGVPAAYPGTYSASIQAGEFNPQQLPILVNDMPLALPAPGMVAANTDGRFAPRPANPSVANLQPGVGYSAVNLPPLVADTNAVNAGGFPGAAVMPSGPRYSAVYSPPASVQFSNLPPLVADTAAVHGGGSLASLPSVRYSTAIPLPLPTQFEDLPLVDDTAAVNAGGIPTSKPANNPAVILSSVPPIILTATQATTSAATLPSTLAATPTTKCTHRAPAISSRPSAVLSSGAAAVPAVPANTAASRYLNATPGVVPASGRKPFNPIPPPAQTRPGRLSYGNAYGAAMAPTALAVPEIPENSMPTAVEPIFRAQAPAGQFFEQNIETTVTVTAIEDLPPNVLHAMRHMGAFEFTS
ncbi:hypothetical protein GGI20_004827 [Coemansia sp. BCRC 34301]|nr:hypothetical protein GGI20_004827 [Coemansia sp. BCRC 34301]